MGATATKAEQDTVLEATEKAVSLTLVKPSDVAGSPAAEASRMDREIRDGFRAVLGSKHRLTDMIAEAKSQKIHLILNDPETGKPYKSWTAYMKNVVQGFGVDAQSLSKGDRDLMIAVLYGAGMSIKQAADTLGTSFGTAQRAVAKAKAGGDLDDAANETEDVQGRRTRRSDSPTPTGGKSDAQKVVDRLTSLQKFVSGATLTTDEIKAIKKLIATVNKALVTA